MHNVIELVFDQNTERAIRSLQANLAEEGFSSKVEAGAPHISLTSSEPVAKELIAEDLQALATQHSPLHVEFSFLGIFPGPTAVAFLGITASCTLLRMQEALYSRLATIGVTQHPLYAPGKLVLHTTLGAGYSVVEASGVLRTALKIGVPSTGLVTSIA